jgi:hypothetical protein
MTEAEAEEAVTEDEADDRDAVSRPAATAAPQRKPSLTPSMFSTRTTGAARARRASEVEEEQMMTRHDLDNKYFHKDLLIFRNWDAFRFVFPRFFCLDNVQRLRSADSAKRTHTALATLPLLSSSFTPSFQLSCPPCPRRPPSCSSSCMPSGGARSTRSRLGSPSRSRARGGGSFGTLSSTITMNGTAT